MMNFVSPADPNLRKHIMHHKQLQQLLETKFHFIAIDHEFYLTT